MIRNSDNRSFNIPAKRIFNLTGWLVGLVGSVIYLLTMEPMVSFWDCGEFIASSYKLQVSHPPGAPLYQLLAKVFMLLAGSNTAMVAWWSNALSAVAGGLTAMFLFWTVARVTLFFKPQDVSFSKSILNGSVPVISWFSNAPA